MTRDEVAAEEVAAVFRTVTPAVLAAVAAGGAMAVILSRLGLADSGRSTSFMLVLGALASAHILMQRRYVRDAARASRWFRWGFAFASVALLEGVCWGWTAYGLVSPEIFQAEVFCLLVSGGVAVSSISVFAAFLPAFLAFFIPAVAPFIVCGLLGTAPLQRGVGILALIYFTAMLIFGISSNRSFRKLIILRMGAETLASELQTQVKIAEAANRAKSSFLAAASHDLRQPVHAIGLFIGALRTMEIPANALHVVEQIEASSLAMDALFAALLDISRLDAGIVEVHKTAFAIGPMLDRICSDYASEASDKGLVLRLHPSSLFVRSDPTLTEQVLRNLVSNAVRYTRMGRIVIGCRRRGAFIYVQVHDTGPGIPIDQRELIFDEYYQLGNAERDRAKGLGLGLAIVRRTTKLLGCELLLSSKLERGSSFSMVLPVAADRSRGEAPTSPSASKGGTIVVIDDEADIRTAMSLLLSGWGHEVFTAASATEAIERLACHPTCPDLVISDLRLRGPQSGIDAIAALRRRYNVDVPAFLITGDTAPQRLVEARDSGLLLLHKPLSNEKLRAVLGNFAAGGQEGNSSKQSESIGT